MNLICDNEKCGHNLKNIDVFEGWNSRKLSAAVAIFAGDKNRLRIHQENSLEQHTRCPACGSRMTRESKLKVKK